jgi:ATP-binding cassette, subfamily C, bacterial
MNREARLQALLRPLAGPTVVRPFVLFARILRAEPGVAATAVTTHIAAAFTGALAIAMLLPLLSLLGSAGGPAASKAVLFAERMFAAIGMPLALGPVLCAIFVVGAAEIALRAYHNLYLARLGETLRAQVRKLVFRRIMQASWQQLVGSRRGELIGAIVQESSNAAKAYLQALKLFGVLVVLAIYFALAAWVSWQFTAFALALALLSLALFRPLYRRSRAVGTASVVNNAALVEALEEHVGAVKLIRAMNAEEASYRRVARLIDESAAYFRRVLSYPILMRLGFEPLALAALLATIWVSMQLLGLGLAEIIVLIAVYTRIVPQLMEFQQALQFVVSSLPAYEHVGRTLETLAAAPERGGTERPPADLRQGIELRGVSLALEGRPVLRNVHLTIDAGTIVALVGESGAGKTSLIDVITGMRPADAGEVLVDGVPIAQLSLPSFRDRLALVPQESIFFHDTIRNNLTIFAPKAHDRDIWSALDQVAAADFVRERALGLDAVLGDDALRVSGGQRQRLALARALLRRPQLLILDEPTSALDPDTEAAVLQSLLQLRGRVTVLVVTHRQSFLGSADRVYRLVEGALTEEASSSRSAAKTAAGSGRD